MSDRIHVTCTGCGVAHKLPPSAAGRSLGCPACGTDIAVPADGQSAPPPPLSIAADPGPPYSNPPPIEKPAPPQVPVGARTPVHAAEAGQGYDPQYKPWEGHKPPLPTSKDFFSKLQRSFIYPAANFQSGLFLLFIVPIWLFLRLGVGVAPGIVFRLFVFIVFLSISGFMISYGWKIMRSSGMGEDEPPDAEIMAFGEAFWEFVRYIVICLFSFAPVIVLAFLLPVFGWLVIPVMVITFIGGVFYLPMALLIGEFIGALSVLNFKLGFGMIKNTLKSYLVVFLYFLASFAGYSFMETYFLRNLEGAWLILAVVLSGYGWWYLQFLQMRVLGVFFLCHQTDLNMFGEQDELSSEEFPEHDPGAPGGV